MSRQLFTDFDSMITQMISDTPPTCCNNCEFFFTLPGPEINNLGVCIKVNIHVDNRQQICDWRRLCGIRMLAERAEFLVPAWLHAIKRWCMGDGDSIEQLAKGFLADKSKTSVPGGGDLNADYLKKHKA